MAAMSKRDRKIRSYIEHAIGRLKNWGCLLLGDINMSIILLHLVFVHISNMMFDEQPLCHLPHHSLWE